MRRRGHGEIMRAGYRPSSGRQSGPIALGWRSRTGLALLIAAMGLSGLALVTDQESQPPVVQATTTVLSQSVADVRRSRANGRDQALQPAGRPVSRITLADENRGSPTEATTNPAWVSGIVANAPVFMADVALPWRYHISRPVLDRIDEAPVHAGVDDWNGLPATRWAAVYAGVTEQGQVQGDGLSTIFLEDSCEGLTNANAYIYTDGGIAIRRYGSSGTQIIEVDIGICPRIGTAAEVRRAIRHEIGHVAGLGHICDPGDECFHHAMGDAGQACRVMYWQARLCQGDLSEGDIAGIQAIYPRLRPLSGPTPETTLARTAFGTVGDGQAPMVTVVTPDLPPTTRVAAAALAARSGGVLVQGVTGHPDCLSGTASVEANRSLRHRGTLVLVGDWPDACHRMAFDWEVALRVVDDADPDRAVARLASLGGPTDRVVVVEVPGGVGSPGSGGVAAVAMAGALDATLIPVDNQGLRPASQAWLQTVGPGGATLVGGGSALEDIAVVLRGRGVPVDTVGSAAGQDPLDTALRVADRMSAMGATNALITVDDGSVEALGAAVMAARTNAVVLPSGPQADPRIIDWLTVARPSTGWFVGGVDAVQQDARTTYGTLIGS